MSKPGDINHHIVFWIILSILLILRIPLESWTIYLFPSTSRWIEPLYEIGTYSAIVFLVWWERERLSLYHFDFLSVIIIIFFKPLSSVLLPMLGDSNNPLAFPKILSFVIFLIAMILSGFVLCKRINLKKVNRQAILWFIFGIVTGIALFVLYGILMIWWFNHPIPPNPGMIALIAPLYQLGYAAVSEEPVFRGFLWGGLRSLGLKEYWVLLIQAILFTVAHIHLLITTQPVLSFSMVFINAIIFGLFVWRVRSLSVSMAVHGFANGSVMVQYWVYSLLFR